MRGEVIHYDQSQGFGFLTGADGGRYTFRREDLRRDTMLAAGDTVEFEPSAGQAKRVFSVRATVADVTTVAGATVAATPAPWRPQPTPMQAPAAAARPPSIQPNFGRHVGDESAPAGTGLFEHFRNGLTTNYAKFRGRAPRKEYWGYMLFWTIAFAVVMTAAILVDGALGNFDGGDFPFLTVIAPTALVLATIIPSFAITVRRMHDIGVSGWLYLLVLIPYVGSLIVFVFTLIPSQTHDNRWGPVPEGIKIPPPYTAMPIAPT